MSPSGKIINIDAFKKKESGVKQPPSRMETSRWKSMLKRKGVFAAILAVMSAVAISLLMAPGRRASITIPPVNSIAQYNIKAPEDMLIEDKESTEKNRRQAGETTMDVYDFDGAAEKNVANRVKGAFDFMAASYSARLGQAYQDAMAMVEVYDEYGRLAADRKKMGSATRDKRYADARSAMARFEQEADFARLEKEFAEKLGVELDHKELEIARQYHYWPMIGNEIAALAGPSLAKGIVARKGQMPISSVKGITLRDTSSGSERTMHNFDDIYDMPGAIKRIRDDAGARPVAGRPAMRKMAAHLAQKLIQPNVNFNMKETDLRRDLAASEAKPVYYRLQRGEMIVREGERVTQNHVDKLAAVAGSQESRGRFKAFFGLLMVNLLLMTMSAFFLKKFHEDIAGYPRLQVMMAALIASHLAILWVSSQVFTMFLPQTPRIDLSTYMLAAPLAFGPMIVSIYFTSELTVLFSVAAAAFTLIMFRGMPTLALLTIAGGLVCAHQVRGYSRRASVLKAGLVVAMVNFIIVLAIDMTGQRLSLDDRLADLVFAVAGGAMASLLVSGGLPVIESVFPVVSDIKLLEIANLNHPLLRRMILEAPGTYHHCMMVGNLAEEACKTIGANALLARAGALFHDIGKMKMPEYFVENQRDGVNPHDKLTPYMSTLIVTNHIKEGMELARQNRLLPQVAAMIPEHHGTQLVRYFYAKAKEAEDSTRDQVKEVDFRYPGPIPSSKESAIVALADSIEAAARACAEPTPGTLKSIVTEVINDKFIQGQLDNSHLTLKDLAEIAHSFVHVLAAIHHHRIRYPEMPVERDRRQANADTDSPAIEKGA
ncbi:MAG: HDIG domain-containing protein [Nitrospinae bacterium]|nr:HDIG domain-containing protein [Nitrospinota bacterium]